MVAESALRRGQRFDDPRFEKFLFNDSDAAWIW